VDDLVDIGLVLADVGPDEEDLTAGQLFLQPARRVFDRAPLAVDVGDREGGPGRRAGELLHRRLFDRA
jgi:hypothetical protein